jgi:excisionase family DNA binding protein
VSKVSEEEKVPEILTTDEAAQFLRVSKRTLQRLHIPYAKVGKLRRYLREDVLNYLREKAA